MVSEGAGVVDLLYRQERDVGQGVRLLTTKNQQVRQWVCGTDYQESAGGTMGVWTDYQESAGGTMGVWD